MIKTIFPHFNHSSSTAWIERIIPQDRCSPGWEAGLHHMTWSLIRRGVMMTQSLSIQGAENFPTEGPVVIVANHSSHLDTLLLGAAVPRLVRSRFSPLAAGDTFFRNPFQNWFASRFLNLRPLWRHQAGSHSLMRLRQNLTSSDQCFLVFPEGTRTRSGDMTRFKPGIGMLVAGTQIPVIPCHIRGAFEAWPSHRKLPSKGDLHLEVGKARTFSSHSSTTSDWRDIAHELEEDVRSLA
tara:strand:+ start:15739 stop:16452 length:714 start_codon:yes stop_codon:yes gene_type:complete